jgi:LAGLIDADG endonuclease
VSGADNQQERLIQLGWVTGFVDGEGCFSIGFVRQAGGANRIGYKVGFRVSHRFVVTQGIRSRSALEELRRFFGIGRVYVGKRHDNHREHLGQFIVNRRDELLGTVIPFFQAHPLRTTKQQDFEKFARCMRLIESGRHHGVDGLVEIAESSRR